ncbi:MAG: hypothetical protein MI725_06435 [Pirellulales bacterium]|nr:hypothetical protein [Pirellulales bacterium]
MRDNIVALTSSHSHSGTIPTQTVQDARQAAQNKLAPPGLLRCLVVSWSERRMQLLRRAAEAEAWEAISCSDSVQFLRNVFQQKVPLMLVDLPPASAAQHGELRAAAKRAKEVSQSLVAVSMAEGTAADEIWARQLGVWSYLPEMTQQEGWELVFRDARQALARQASAYLEANFQAGQQGGGLKGLSGADDQASNCETAPREMKRNT